MDLTERGTILDKLKEIELTDLEDLKQGSKVKWLVDGDENTKYFHSVVRNRRRSNSVNGVIINGV